MAVQLRSGATSDLLTIDPVASAARATLYDDSGVALSPMVTGAYIAAMNVRATVTLTQHTLFAFRNSNTRTVYITRIYMIRAFDGTAPATGRTSNCTLLRFDGGGSYTGGTGSATIGKKKTSYGASAISSIIFNPGASLTTSGTVNTSSLMFLPVIHTTTSRTTSYDVRFNRSGDNVNKLVLRANEGLVIQQRSVAGLGIYGFIEWYEI